MAHRTLWRMVVALSGIAFFLAGPACSKKSADIAWKADVEVVDGVKTVRNPETPRYGDFAFNLVEDLAFGDEDNEAYLFPRGATLSIDNKGAFYICDYGNKRVQVFDREGRFVRTLGHVGQGPGEYTFPSSVHVDADGNVYITNGGRSLIVFSPDGIFRKNIAFKTFLSRAMLGLEGTIVGTIEPNPGESGGARHKLVQLGSDGESLRTLAEFPAFGVVNDLVINHWYTDDLCFCPRSTDSLYYGYSLDYTVHVVDSGGRPLLAFSRAEDPVSISAEEKALTRKGGIFTWSGVGDPEKTNLGMPGHRPFFSRFFSDDAGRLYVVRFRPITEKDVAARDVDVFSKDGFYLYRLTWPFLPQVIKDGFLYEVRQDEDKGLTRIVRHRIKNWGDFRAQ